jgi:hypothetical protein
MHRKPQLQEAARKLQEIFNGRAGDISYVQALEILGQLEGFEGYQQLRTFIAKHSQNPGKVESPIAPFAAAPVEPAAQGPLQTLAMTLCGHEGFRDGYKRVQNRRVDVRFVQMADGEMREIRFVKGKTILMQLADNEAGFPHETPLDPDEVVAQVKGDDKWGDNAWTMGFAITVNAMRGARHQTGGHWTVGGWSLLFWDVAPMPVPVKTRSDLPNPSEMTREQYIALSDELDRHEMSHAMGEENDYMYVRMKNIDRLLGASPWCRDMDSGQVVLRSESIYGTKPESFTQASGRDGELAEFGKKIAAGEVSPEAPFDGMNREWTRAETEGFHNSLAEVFSWKPKDSGN